MCLRMRHSEVHAQVDIEDQELPVEELADDAVVCADGASTWCSWIDESGPPRPAAGCVRNWSRWFPKNVLDGRYAYFLLTKAD